MKRTPKRPDLIYMPDGTWPHREPGHFCNPFQLTIHAVGRTVEEALTALGKRHGWGKVTDLAFQSHTNAPVEWYVRFAVDGTSMKAAGHYLTGGVIVTWWI